MKGLPALPGPRALHRAYERLQFHRHSVKEEDIALWSQWTRFDPRLGEIMVDFLSEEFVGLNPLRLQMAVAVQPWPACLGVLVEHVRLLLSSGKQRPLFESWAACAISGIRPAPFQLYYFGLYRLGGRLSQQRAERSARPFQIWGFLESDLMLNKAALFPRTVYDPQVRRRLLDQLIQEKTRIRVGDYLRKVGPGLSLRQAQRDLRNHPRLSPRGATKGRYYIVAR